jgi:hypothetical protein
MGSVLPMMRWPLSPAPRIAQRMLQNGYTR